MSDRVAGVVIIVLILLATVSLKLAGNATGAMETMLFFKTAVYLTLAPWILTGIAGGETDG